MSGTLVVETVRLGTELKEFQSLFPSAQVSRGQQSDYDPDLWKNTIRFQEYASARETIAGITLDVSVAFSQGLLTFLQYFGRPTTGNIGYEAGGRAYGILAAALQNTLGPSRSTVPFRTYEAFVAEERPTGGYPDERWVEAAAQTWPRAWIHLGENAYGSLTLELRMEAL